MSTPLRPCVACARHHRVTDARCPFCGAPSVSIATDLPALSEGPSPVARAVIVALGASLTAGACQQSVPVSDTPRVANASTQSSLGSQSSERPRPPPSIVAPYGAPPPPRDPNAEPTLLWYVTMSNTIAMSARASTPLLIVVSNPNAVAVPSHRERLHLRVNGVLSPAFDLAFNNGATDGAWDAVPPGARLEERRNILEALFPAPGEYLLVLEIDGRRVGARSMTVTP